MSATTVCATCKRELAEGESAWASDWNVIDVTGISVGHRTETRYTCDDCEAAATPTNGMCTACGAVEVELVKVDGTRDLSAMGEHHAYPTGYGCEVCA